MKRTMTTLISLTVLLAAAATADTTPGKGSDKKDAATDTTAKQARQMKDDAAERSEKARQHAADKAARSEKSHSKEKSQRTEKSAGNKGNETAKEMQARRDERKQIQKEYREADEESRPTGKKPWWKFWASDDA